MPHRELHPLLFSNSVWVLLRPTELIMKSCETGTTVYRPLQTEIRHLSNGDSSLVALKLGFEYFGFKCVIKALQ